ncbi:MAG: ATPase RavA stimulator ViaA [Enterobacteriaceae bacterium]|jgi:uncharacterized protein with von Willebrand factor type A (vWA) domain|nr:ATPase RavA stimulator ViaA [Enterobacteriaceae bacterium]
MLTLATIDLLLSISEGELIEEITQALLSTPQLAIFFEKHPKLKQALMQDLPEWKQILRQKIKETTVPAPLAEEFQLYQYISTINPADFYQQLSGIADKLQQFQSPFAKEADALFKSFSVSTERPEYTSSRHILFMQRWRASLIEQVTVFSDTLLEKEKDQFLTAIQKRLTLINRIDPLLDEDDHAAGRLWDISKGPLHLSEHKIDLITQYAKFLKQQPELEQLAQVLGRSQTAKSVPKDSPTLEPFNQIERTPDTVPEQVSGIRHSDDILRLLPAELATLGIEGLEYEFYRRWAEKKLLTYRLQGESWQTKTVLKPIIHHNHEEQPRGPFIICVDTSGSMGGFNECCAKAFCLALMRIALADNRKCHIILFSTECAHYDLTSQDGLTEAVHFLGQTFRGGTDLAFCLKKTIEKMQDNVWENADAVVISDFIAQRLPDTLIHQIQNLQQHQQHSFHAVSLSDYGKPGIMQIFDHIWRFDTGMTSRLLRRWQR